jgi:hypothetical protein
MTMNAKIIGNGIVSGLLGASIWVILFGVILKPFPSSHIDLLVVAVLAGIAGAIGSYREK